MQKRWVLKSKSEVKKVNQLSNELGINPVLAELLVSRNIETFDASKHFFRPSLDQLHNPFLMQDMEKAIARITTAIGQNEKILIYGDYDVDGTTAVAVVYSFFREFHSRIEFYIPDRYAEGYGISTQGIDYAAENGFSLIIALDCGIKANDKVEYANSKNIDFIIGDHHLPGDELPPAFAVLDPKRKDCNYPYKELSGCGIGFKLIQAFIMKNDMSLDICYQYLDLVAVSIASDIVPITGENRILTHFGLIKLNTNPCCGLQALVDLSTNKTKTFTVNDIVFQIGPRINASGRIDHAKDAVKLLISKSLQEAKDFSINIDDQNNVRKDFDLRITEEALAIIDDNDSLKTRKSTVLYKSDWHKGVIGIVASRLTERYYRPTIILTETNGHIAGSCRSVIGFDLYEALSECSDLLDQFGGHKYAAGLTMQIENIKLFQDRFEQVVTRLIKPEMLTQEILIDTKLHLQDIDAKFHRILSQFEPFGPQNESPIFLSQKVSLIGSAYLVGSNHLKMTVKQEHSPSFDCIGFGLSEHIETINSGKPFDMCYSIEENVWRGKKNLQLNLKGIRY
ncbi:MULTISPECIES: single-stranded-DNA-specific exonuclease RecJ [Sphingobacterium]|jgi:single-stranded-DNA-specific exonuclease|uniref:single-stranded-DNA-specific exonuclease RecJ n=1 Tax=Sphingobacterium TaxID=28453 RepID=UPI0004E5FA7E|nr:MULTISPECIES: single-stranded-DNA-specific exonuclease RecJ [Sphingobacterium]CDS92902.1 Single-strand DNA specific exonuclease [Sphingobacterium sp. PM2-P1-29]SJN51430.1 Single-stranded-DNA-specific exonuclease RecJ [Sphingobacterium faecium PCAi_F2.5]HCU43620.1 single-stranded-DNA-specific exonuclease RecJ [Sphingobacterium sp.]UPZ38335.1 single-stranded-DNA-specific exonuclease RecJ [Sphingobacterium sp. PCS056]UXD69769.1 single-stranded-DNA-specific exonuclease RecJ [Sphingobacterium fa